MRAASKSIRPGQWGRSFVASVFTAITSGYRVRLDFSDGEQILVGPSHRSVDVAVRPPASWRLLWILLRPGLRLGESFVQADWDITQGDLATLLRIIQTPKLS